MSEVEEFSVVLLSTWDAPSPQAARIEGVVEGQRFAAIVSPELAEDEPAARAHLVRVAAEWRGGDGWWGDGLIGERGAVG